MSEDVKPYGAQSADAQAAQELRALIESAGLTQVAAANELDYSDRTMRRLCSGDEPVPRAVLYAMRWLVDHKPNSERWLQIHWKTAGVPFAKGDKFEWRQEGDRYLFFKNGQEEISGTMDELLGRGLVSVHTAYSSGRFLLPAARVKPVELWMPVPAGKSLDQAAFYSEDRETAAAHTAKAGPMELWRAERVA